jgi:hypothetical protein
MISVLWYVLIGALLANGVPHFVAGAAGVTFRSPFGLHTAPKINFGWGLTNFIAATLLVVWRITAQAPHKGEWIALLVGFWLAIILFGAGAKRFYPKEMIAPKAEKNP